MEKTQQTIWLNFQYHHETIVSNIYYYLQNSKHYWMWDYIALKNELENIGLSITDKKNYKNIYYVKNHDEAIKRVLQGSSDVAAISSINYEKWLKNNQKENLVQFGRAYYDFAQKNPHLWSLIFEHHVAGGGDINPDLGERIQTLFDLVESEIQSLNVKKDKAEIHAASLALWSGVHGITILAITDKLFMADGISPQEMIDQLINNFLTGYCPK